MTITATRSNDLPNHVDGNGKSRYAVHVNQQGRIRPFDDYALPAWYDDEPNAALWAAQQLCVHIVDNGLATCPFRDRLLLFYPDVLKALMPNSNVDTDSITSRYNAFVTEYNSTIGTTTSNDQPVAPVAAVPVVTSQPAPAPQPTRVVERDVVTSPAPVAEPVIATAPIREPASEPTRVAERDDSVAPAWFGEFREEFAGKVNKHDATLYGENGNPGLVDRVERLENAMPRDDNGEIRHHSTWFDRTVNHTATVAGFDVRWAPAIAAFLIALILLVLFWAPNAFEAGFWFSLSQGWKWFWSAVISIFVLVLTNLRLFTKTASAA